MTTQIPRYKIIGSPDGCANGSKIIDLVTGQPLMNVSKISINMEAGCVCTATVELVGVVADVTILDSKLCREYAKVNTAPSLTDEQLEELFKAPEAQP